MNTSTKISTLHLAAITLVLLSSFAAGAPPTLGSYPNTTVTLGANTTVTPDAPPTGVVGINVATDTHFKGTFVATPATGVVRVTNAHPAGTYVVTVTAFGPGGTASRTFTLTVLTGTACNAAVQFTNIANVSVGEIPRSVAIGDFNNDGKQDFATANSGDNAVSIRLGNGGGGFSSSTDVAAGSGVFSVAIGDFNNDGNQDFATADILTATVSIRLGDGLGGFSGTTTVGVGNGPQSVAIGDFNNDGKQDFAAANNGAATVSIRFGDGLGNFSGSTEVSVGTNPSFVAIGDFNNDGKQDFANSNQSAATVSIRLGDGLGGFSGTTDVSVGVGPRSVAIGDFNNDGKQDFAAANNSSNTVSIRLGDGLGGFGGTSNVIVGSEPEGIAIGDFNNDGKQDFASTTLDSTTNNRIAIRLGDGLGNFSAATDVLVGDTPTSIALGDFNNDGRQDFAALNQADDTVSIRLGGCAVAPPTPTPTATPTPTPATLRNISTRVDVGIGENVLIGGFIITGTDPKNVILRALGPSINIPGVSGLLADPLLELHEPDGTIVINDNWRDTQEQEIIDTGIPPNDDLESAIVATLDPGEYTAIVRGVDGATGVALVEAYDLDTTGDSQLANLSTRGLVMTDDSCMIAGFILGPDTNGASSVVVRAIGPSLAGFDVAGPLLDPTLELHNGDGDLIASNDNWLAGPDAQTIDDDGLAPPNDSESALLLTAAPGEYTAIVRGVDDTTGVALIEVYHLQ